MNFFFGHFPLHEFFFGFFPTPLPHHFSNGPSLRDGPLYFLGWGWGWQFYSEGICFRH